MKKTRFLLVFLFAFSLETFADGVLRVLAIGNSFSEDAVEQNLWDLGHADGQQMIIANMYIGGCSLERHWKNASNNLGEYRYRKIGVDGVRRQEDGMTLLRALKDEQWDVVSLQQASGLSGKIDSYEPFLSHLIDYIRKISPKSRIVWHMTWAYAQESNHTAFPDYGCNQLTMYQDIVAAVRKEMKKHRLKTVVPCGTAIQNARTTFIHDNMTRDGYHLDLDYGRYTAACTWYESLTGNSVVGNRYAPQNVCSDLVRAAQLSAHSAVEKPWEITDLSNVNATYPLYKDASVPLAIRVQDLLSRMTLNEKAMQLVQYTLGTNNIENNKGIEVKNIPESTGSLIFLGVAPDLRNRMQYHAVEDSRLGIPILFGYDVIHGFRTIFPIPLAQACSFNPHLTRLSCRAAAQEARMSGVDWTFSPMIDVAHDPRWGRVAEGYGEDPYLNGIFGAAAVRGYQGKSLDDSLSVAACLKHYVAYGASEAGRDYTYTEVSRQTLWDTYLPPYRKAMEANPAAVMSSFNNLSGLPVTANRYVLTDVLRGKLGFKGFVVSDWAAIMQLQNQGAAKDLKTAGQLAMNAGLDMDMMSHAYDAYLEQLLHEGAIDSATIDRAVRRVLKVKFELGLFEHPYTPDAKDDSRFLRPESRQIEEELAEESMVLLKNNNNILPIRNEKSIAVIGPLATSQEDLLGCWAWHGQKEDVTTILDAMRQQFAGKITIGYAKGCDFEGSDQSGFKDALSLASKSDMLVVCLGEKQSWSGENASRSSIELPEIQLQLLQALKKTGKKIVLVLSNGRPLQLNKIEALSDAIIEMWQPGIAGGIPLARILSGEVCPSGKLAITFPYTTGQIPIYYNRRPSARPNQGFYHDIQSEPMYPFGYGLSYTRFQYGTPVISKTVLHANDKFTIDIPVTNTGSHTGKEIVLGFVHCQYSPITRPMKELRFFAKDEIQPGRTVTYHFDLQTKRDLGFVDENGNIVITPGKYEIMVGDHTIEVEVQP